LRHGEHTRVPWSLFKTLICVSVHRLEKPEDSLGHEGFWWRGREGKTGRRRVRWGMGKGWLKDDEGTEKRGRGEEGKMWVVGK